MSVFCHFLSRRWLLAFLGVATILFGLAMLHPYPRQSLFGPTVRGKPRCYWEAELRRAHRPPSFAEKFMGLFGVEHPELMQNDLFDDPEMLPLVLELLDEPDHNLRGLAMTRIAMYPSLQDRSALPALHRRLREDDIHNRNLAAQAIWKIDHDKTVLAIFVELLNDADPGYRALGMYSAAMTTDAPDLYPHIIALAKDSNPRVRCPVMFAMQHYGKKGVPILIDGLNDPNAEVRLNAVWALGFLGPQAIDAVPALEVHLNDSSPFVRVEVSSTLHAIDRERFKHLKGVGSGTHYQGVSK